MDSKVQIVKEHFKQFFSFTIEPFKFPNEFYRKHVIKASEEGPRYLIDFAALLVLAFACGRYFYTDMLTNWPTFTVAEKNLFEMPVLGELLLSLWVVMGFMLIGAFIGSAEILIYLLLFTKNVQIRDHLYFRILLAPIVFVTIVLASPIIGLLAQLARFLGIAMPDTVVVACTSAVLGALWIYPAWNIMKSRIFSTLSPYPMLVGYFVLIVAASLR